MKKMLFVIVMTLFTVVAQATNIKWGLQQGNAIGEKFAGGIAYLLVNTVSAEVLSYGEGEDLNKVTKFTIDKIKDEVFLTTSIDGTGYFSNTTLVNPTDEIIAGIRDMYIVAISASGDALATLTQTGKINVQNSPLNAVLLRPEQAFTIYDAVPEPTTFALLALGLAAFGLKRKVKK